MAAIILPHRWRTQPGGLLQVDRSHPIGAHCGTAFIQINAAMGWDAARQKPVTATNVPSASARRAKEAFFFEHNNKSQVVFNIDVPTWFVIRGTWSVFQMLFPQQDGTSTPYYPWLHTGYSYGSGNLLWFYLEGWNPGVLDRFVVAHKGDFVGGDFASSAPAFINGSYAPFWATSRGDGSGVIAGPLVSTAYSGVGTPSAASQSSVNLSAGASGMHIGPFFLFDTPFDLDVYRSLIEAPFQFLQPLRRRLYFFATGGGLSAISGTAALNFGEGSSSLTASGALAGAAALTFDDGTSTLTASGALAGSADITFDDGASTLTAAGELTGTAALTFDDGASSLTGAGALAGTAALVFANTGSLTDLTAGSIAGTAALTFDDGASALVGSGALAGTAAMAFTLTAAAQGAGALAGAAALAFTNAGDLTGTGSGAIAGTAAMVFDDGTSSLAGAGAMAGSAAMQLNASAVISGGAFIAADRRFVAPSRSRSFNLSP